MGLVTPDRALIYAIIAGGVPAFQTARTVGVEASHLFDDDRKIFEACEEIFLPKGRMPNITDIRLHLKIELAETAEVYDAELCAKEVVRRALSVKLNTDIGPIIDVIPDDPYKARDMLSELVQGTNWSIGNIVSTSQPSAIEEIKKRYV